MTAINSVSSARLPLPAFSPRAVLMYSAALGGEGAVALQLREAAPGEAALTEVAAGTVAGRLHEDRALAIACHDPELLADLLHAAADIGNGSAGGLSSLLGSAGSASPDPAGGSDASDSLPPSDHDADRSSSGSSSSGVTTVSVSVAGLAGLAGLDTRPPLAVKRVRPKAASPNRQGPQQCQVCNKIFGNASALAKHKLTHSDERKYVCGMCAKAFKRQDHLNGHMLTHRNKKPYECKASGCGKSYCDARSLRRHTENHHHAPHPQDASSNGSNSNSSTNAGCDRGAERSCIQYARGASPGSPARPAPAHSAHSDSNSSGSDKASPAATDGDSAGGSPSPAGSPPAPLTPPAPRAPPRPVAKPQPTAKHKTFAITVQHGQQRSPTTSSSLAGSTTPSAPATTSAGGGGTTGGVAARAAEAPAGVAASKPHEIKPVECNLCHRKFKNIPALNGHMRLHGGYFKKDSENKKLDKKEATGPPLQTASVSVRALIEEKIISRRGANAANLESLSSARGVGFVTPAPPPLTSTAASRPLATPLPHSTPPPPAPSAARAQFVSPRAPTAVSPATHRDSTLIELLKKGTKVAVKRSASDPGAQSPEIAFRPELFGVTFAADDGYFSPALNDDAFQFSSTTDHLDDLASLEDYASVAASLRERSPVGFPSNRRLAAVLNSPLPEGLADFGAYHSTNSTSIEPALPSPGFAYPTPPASHEARSPSQTASNAVPPRASSPLSAAFFTATMSSAEEVEEALEEVLPDECDAGLDVYAALDESTTPQDFPTRLHEQMMLNSEDPLLSSNPREFGGRRKFAFGQTYRIVGRDPSDPRMASVLIESNGELKLVHAAWPSTDDTQRGAGTSGIPGLQVEVEGREVQCGDVFLSPSSIPASPVRSGRKRARAETAGLRGPHRSRLRMDDREHYTPLPILNPDRFGLGLYAELYPGSFLPPLDEAGTEAPSESRRVPRINVGPEHQACIPSVEPDRGRLDREPSCEQLLWDPGINDTLDDNEVRMFMDLAMCAAMPVGGHSREFALQTLGECGGDVRAATLRLMSRTPARPDDDASSGRQDPHHHQRWTPEEVEAFLAGLRDYDKDFYKISRLIRSKDSKQCVQFYYFWKKVTKDYKSLFLQSWSPDTRGAHQSLTSRGLTPQGHSPCTGSPAPYDSEEFPCKICGKVFNKVKSRSAHMKSHRPLDAESKRPKVEKPYEKVEKHDERSQPPPEHGKTPLP